MATSNPDAFYTSLEHSSKREKLDVCAEKRLVCLPHPIATLVMVEKYMDVMQTRRPKQLRVDWRGDCMCWPIKTVWIARTCDGDSGDPRLSSNRFWEIEAAVFS